MFLRRIIIPQQKGKSVKILAKIKWKLVISLVLFAFCFNSVHAAERRIALTYDDAPRPDGAFMSGEERTATLIKALKESGVSEAGIFVTTGNISSDKERARVLAFANAGHVIANHSHTHSWLKDTKADAYLADLDRAEVILKNTPNKKAWFRFPYLDEGREQAKHDSVHAGLKERGLINAYVTIDNFDWHIDNIASKAIRSGRCDNTTAFDEALKAFYIEALVGASDFFDKMALQYLGRSPAHSLLLHENDLAAKYAKDLVAALRKEGWQIIPATQVYEDPFAKQVPDTLFSGGGRIAAHARIQGADYKDLFHWSADEKEINERFEKSVLSVCNDE